MITPDVLVCSVGTEIAWKQDNGEFVKDEEWSRSLDEGWDAAIVSDVTSDLDPDIFQRLVHPLSVRGNKESEQRPHRIGFYAPNYSTVDGWDAMLDGIRKKLHEGGIQAQVMFSGGLFLDILPVGAGKGHALSHILKCLKDWGQYPIDGVQVNGDSGNDIDLFMVDHVRGCIVSNAKSELKEWAREHDNQYCIFFATKECAAAIVEALYHFKMLENAPIDRMKASVLRAVRQLSSDSNDGSFLSNSFMLYSESDTVKIGQYVSTLKNILEFDADRISFLDGIEKHSDIPSESSIIKTRLCHVFPKEKARSRMSAPLHITLKFH